MSPSRGKRWRPDDTGYGLGDRLRLALEWVADAVGGRVQRGDPQREIGDVVIDTRVLQPGDFFVALRGNRFDGHDFVGEALSRGAGGVIVQRGTAAVDDQRGAVIEVEDTTKALQDLARAVRTASGTRVVAITGSAGKTTTKETIAEFLSARFRVVKNKGNLNNHIGLPLSLLQLRERPDVAVMELGMNHRGEISTLVAIAEPELRVWTNVGNAHIGFFGSTDAIADAKAEILERATPDDVLVCNADDRRVMARAGAFAGKIVTFGTSTSATVSAREIEDLGINGMRARLFTPVGERILNTPLLGRGNLDNVLASIAVALEMDISLDALVSATSHLQPGDRRGAVRRLRGGVVLIDDSYNSSPAALRRTLDVVGHEEHVIRKVAVLGEMLELGEQTIELHEQSGRYAAAAGLHLLVAVGGEGARHLADAAVAAGMAPSSVTYFERSDLAAAEVAAVIKAGDLVLVKGSRGTRTDVVADRIAAEFG
jgi:UDP-N-acetylmuramoyl-tripeptide--D-alanyl-D-alanine ligase